MTNMNFVNVNGHCFPLRAYQARTAEPDEDVHCIHCGTAYTGTCSPPCKGPPPYAPVAPTRNVTYPGALHNVTLNGQHVTRFVSIPSDETKGVTLAVDFEAWSNIKNGAQTALLLASELPLRGEVVVTDGKRPVRCYISRCFRIGQVECCPIWLACLKVVAHAEKRKSQKRELRRLNQQLGTMTNERNAWRGECRKARGEKP